MSVTNKLTGKASSLTYGGTTLPITKHTPSVTRTLADTTDSTDYDPTTNMLWESQIPVKLAQTLKVEGKYNTSTIPSTIIADLYSGNAAAAIVWTLKSGVVAGHGNYDISDFETSAPVNDTVTYSCTAKLNGVFTAGS
jgi:hypothetical protein